MSFSVGFMVNFQQMNPFTTNAWIIYHQSRIIQKPVEGKSNDFIWQKHCEKKVKHIVLVSLH